MTENDLEVIAAAVGKAMRGKILQAFTKVRAELGAFKVSEAERIATLHKRIDNLEAEIRAGSSAAERKT